MKRFRQLCLSVALSLPLMAFAESDGTKNVAAVDEVTHGDSAVATTMLESEIRGNAVHMEHLYMTPILLEKSKKDTDESKAYKNTKYWKRHKTFKALGWTFLGVGVPATALGFFLCVCSAMPDADLSDEQRADVERVGLYCMIPGATLAVASVPMFCLSKANKKKAKKEVSVGVARLATHDGIPSLGLQVALNF